MTGAALWFLYARTAKIHHSNTIHISGLRHQYASQWPAYAPFFYRSLGQQPRQTAAHESSQKALHHHPEIQPPSLSRHNLENRAFGIFNLGHSRLLSICTHTTVSMAGLPILRHKLSLYSLQRVSGLSFCVGGASGLVYSLIGHRMGYSHSQEVSRCIHKRLP